MEKTDLTGLVPLREPERLHIVLCLVSRPSSLSDSLWLTTSYLGRQIKKKKENLMRVFLDIEL